MQLHSSLSATARPFQPGAASSSALVDDTPRDYPAWDGLMRSSPPRVLGICLLERPPPITITPPMRMGCPLIPPSLTSPFAGGVGPEEVKVTRVVVTPMKRAPPEGGDRRRMGFLVKSKSQNSEVRRVILMMWLTPLGSGPIVSLITVTIMRIPTSCP